MNGSTQKELVMKLSAKADPSISEPYRQMARETKSAAREETELQKLIGKRGPLYDTVISMRKRLSHLTGEELEAEKTYQRVFLERIKGYEMASRLKKDLTKAGYGESGGGMLGRGLDLLMNPAMLSKGIASAIGMAVAKEIKDMTTGQRIAEYGFNAKGFGVTPEAQQRRMDEFAEKWLGRIPIVGDTLSYAHRVNSASYLREQNLRESREAVGRNQTLGEMKLQQTLRMNAFERQLAPYHAMAGFSAKEKGDAARRLAQARGEMELRQRQLRQAEEAARNAAKDEAQTAFDPLTQRAIHYNRAGQLYNSQHEAAMKAERDRIRREVSQAQRDMRDQQDILNAGRGLGMNSASEQARIHLAGQAAINRAQQGLMQNPLMAGYNRQAALADYEARVGFHTQKQQMAVEQQRQLGIMTAQQTVAGRHVATARGKVEEAQAGITAAERSLNTARTAEQIEGRRNALIQERKRLELANKELQDAQAHSQELAVRQGEMLNQQSQQRLALLQSERAAMQSIVRQENEREMGRREHFGLAHPMKQRTATRIAEKLARGQRVTFREQEFMQSMPDLFDQRLKQLAFNRTGPGSEYAKIKKLLPELGERKRQAEQHLAKVDQQFHVQIQLNENSLTDQIQKKIIPAVQAAMKQVEQAFQEQLQRFALEQRQQQAQAMRQQ